MCRWKHNHPDRRYLEIIVYCIVFFFCFCLVDVTLAFKYTRDRRLLQDFNVVLFQLSSETFETQTFLILSFS